MLDEGGSSSDMSGVFTREKVELQTKQHEGNTVLMTEAEVRVVQPKPRDAED